MSLYKFQVNNFNYNNKETKVNKGEASKEDPQERINWLRLYRCPRVGVKTFWDLIRLYKTATKALEHLPELTRKGGGKKIEIISEQQAQKEFLDVENFGARIITASDLLYPHLLKQISDAPPILTVKGHVELLNKEERIAIVGARNASANGCILAKKLARELGESGFLVVSGLAKGIDTAAHLGALSFGTIGVIAGGINNIYPSENRTLYEKLYEQGLVVTEFPYSAAPVAKYFPQRNRIISGLSLAVIVVEAALKSGTLITARFALEQGREIFAVPGSPLDIRAHGTNSLIKQGAFLLESAEDVITLLHNQKSSIIESVRENAKSFVNITTYSPPNEKEMDKWRKMILKQLSYTPCPIEYILEETCIPLPIFTQILIELELAGKVERLYGNRVVMLEEEG